MSGTCACNNFNSLTSLRVAMRHCPWLMHPHMKTPTATWCSASLQTILGLVQKLGCTDTAVSISFHTVAIPCMLPATAPSCLQNPFTSEKTPTTGLPSCTGAYVPFPISRVLKAPRFRLQSSNAEVAKVQGARVPKQRLEQAAAAASAAFHQCPNLDILVPAMVDGGIDELEKRCALTPGLSQYAGPTLHQCFCQPVPLGDLLLLQTCGNSHDVACSVVLCSFGRYSIPGGICIRSYEAKFLSKPSPVGLMWAGNHSDRFAGGCHMFQS